MRIAVYTFPYLATSSQFASEAISTRNLVEMPVDQMSLCRITVNVYENKWKDLPDVCLLAPKNLQGYLAHKKQPTP